MTKYKVSVVKYERSRESVKNAVNLINGLKELPDKAKVFIKPNVVYWNRNCDFPKWGVITTSSVIEDIILLLKEKGIQDIKIGEGMELSLLILCTVHLKKWNFTRDFRLKLILIY